MKCSPFLPVMVAGVVSCLGVSATDRSDERRLGSVSGYIDSEMWLEFQSARDGDVMAFGCGATGMPCSTDTMSVPLGSINGSPWTFESTGCTRLTVIEGWFAGDTTYQVLDKGTVLGQTSDGSMDSDCWDDPNFCYNDPLVGKGSWILPAGSHSIAIKKLYQQDEYDGGWFRLESATCPCVSRSTSCAATSSCCSGLVCRRVNVNQSPKQCLTCLAAGKKCTTKGDCCSNKCKLQNGVKKCK